MARKQAPQLNTDLSAKVAAIRASGGGPRSVCFFNNKGGVGKTSLVANLGAQLALNCGAKVLVVDADPQCNLSQYVLTDDEFIEAYSDETSIESIYSIIHPLSIGRGYSEKLPVKKTKNFGFDVVLGDPRLALKEDLLAQDWRDARSGGTRGLRTTFVFSDLIQKASDYDFVFFDMGPSLGAINRSVLLAANFFIVPMSIDIFSLWAIKNISEALKVWRKDLANGLRLAEDPKELEQFSHESRLKFLGYVTQQHKERTEEGSARIVEAYNAINTKIPAEVERHLSDLMPVPTLTSHLGDIKHLASLAPKSQTLHSPMINVSASGSYTSMRKQAREIYTSISDNFLESIALS